MGTIVSIIAQLTQLIAGLAKHQANQTLLIEGVSYTTAEVTQHIQALIDALNATVAARAAYHETVAKSDALMQTNRTLVRDVRQSVQIMYGSTASTLSDYGLTPRKVTVPSAAVKAAAADKAKATRKARHTMGKKQKELITGVTPEVTSTASSPITPAPAVTPIVTPIVPGVTTAH